MTEKPRLADILQQLPSLRKLLGEFGDMSLFDYAKKNYRPTPSDTPLFLERKKEFIGFLGEYLSRKFNTDISEKACESLERNYAVSTAEHHGPMGHPFFFQSAILRWFVNPEEAIVNLCTSHVSLGNSSYPRGIVFHGDGEKAPNEYLKLPFFPASQRMDPVFRHPTFTLADIEKTTLPKLKSYLEANYISKELFESVSAFLKWYVLDEQILNCGTYSEQITLLNHTWWNTLFRKTPYSKWVLLTSPPPLSGGQIQMPDFIPLDAEDIVSELLIRHLKNDTPLTRIMTDIALQPMIEENFDGISCCFDLVKKSWTYLFWYLDKNNNRHSLWSDGGNLMDEKREICIPLKAQSIIQYLLSWSLIPSGLLTYTTLACYYGLTCFGWIFQDTYLTAIKQAYKKIFPTSWLLSELRTNIVNADLYYLFTHQNQPMTAIDFVMKNIEWSSLVQARTTSLQQSIEKCCVDL